MTGIIEVIVAADGTTKLATQGFSGAECRQASRTIEEALGARLSEALTAEFYGQVTHGQRLQQEGQR